MDDRRQLIIRLCAALYASKRYTGSKFDALTGYETQALISHAHSPASRLSYVDEVCVCIRTGCRCPQIYLDILWTVRCPLALTTLSVGRGV